MKSQEYRKVVDFDVYLDKQNNEERAPPWKVKIVQDDRPLAADEGCQ